MANQCCSHLDFFMEKFNTFLKSIQWNKHILDDMASVVQFSEYVWCSCLQESNFWWTHPSHKVTEEHVVSKWYDISELPEDALRVTVVVITERYVFN